MYYVKDTIIKLNISGTYLSTYNGLVYGPHKTHIMVVLMADLAGV